VIPTIAADDLVIAALVTRLRTMMNDDPSNEEPSEDSQTTEGDSTDSPTKGKEPADEPHT
jgi:hypothetical protein